MEENLAVSIKGTGPSDCHFSGSILDLQQDALQRRYILAVIPFFLCVCRKWRLNIRRKEFSRYYIQK